MEIKKRLIMSGSNVVNAVLLNDEGEEYPVFLESLHNTIIFPTLLESGYKLSSLPYGFVKNGVSFDDLPVENYTCDDVQLELMYNSIGAKLPYDEIKSKIDAGAVRGLPIPKTDYTIFTREDFLKYLDATAVASTEDDYLPLNYFVAPEARFSLAEYKHPDNLKYVKLINERREMSLGKFHKLVKWLQTVNLNASPTPMDVLDAYFAWGMDGLDYTVINRRRETRAFRLTTNKTVNVPVIRKTFGFVDGAGNLLTPVNERDVVWKLASSDPDYVNNISRGLAMNETRVTEFRSPAKQEVTILEGIDYNIQYNDETLIMQLQSYPSIRVESPVDIGSYIDLYMAMPGNTDKLVEHCTIEALARMLYSYRKSNIKVSSYDALRICGCNPKTVLNYIVTKYDMAKEKSFGNEDTAPQVMDFDINNYLAGNGQVTDAVKSFLDDVISGVFNIDCIESGKQAEARVNTASVYHEIYAMHNVMGISLQEIYDKIRSIDDSTQVLIFSDGDLQHTVNVSPMQYCINGYKMDVQNYDLQNAKDCTFFTHIIRVAREVGSETANRHIGIEFYLVNKKHKPVQEIIDQLEKMYEEKVYSTIADVTKQASAMRYVHMFALSRYFEIAFKGTITYPAHLGSIVEPALPSMTQECLRYIERKIENITSYCSFTANTISTKKLTFNAYCTNAYVTPEYIIPRGKSPIKEIPFYAAWVDWSSANPAVHAQLVANGVIPADFVAWECRYANEQFVQRDLFDLDSIDSLMYYYTHALDEVKHYPEDKEFIAVTHPIDYMFPGLHQSDSEDRYADLADLPTPRVGEPVVRLGYCRDITIEEYRDKLYPTEIVEEKETFIRAYRGFGAEIFMTVDDVFSKFPKDGSPLLTVMPESETVYVADTNNVINFRRIVELDFNKYPITHVCDRTYLLRSADGKLWEVRI